MIETAISLLTLYLGFLMLCILIKGVHTIALECVLIVLSIWDAFQRKPAP